MVISSASTRLISLNNIVLPFVVVCYVLSISYLSTFVKGYLEKNQEFYSTS